MTSGKRATEQRRAAGRRRPPPRKVQAAAARKRRWGWVGGAVVVAGAAVGLGLGLSGSSPAPTHLKLASLATVGHLAPPPSADPLGPEGVPIPKAPPLATTASDAAGQGVDGISCDTSEQVVFHVHTHLTIFVDGAARQVPYGIGIAVPRTVQQTPQGPFVASGSCFYWLHTHADDGIIHIESPVQRTYTLGDFFAVWGQQLGPDRVGPAKGKVTAFYDGKVYLGNPADIPIGDHVQVQLDVGRPLVAPELINFPSGL
ncbi:MAG: hypothetical protein ACP5P1_13930 [Acidimicrobiales bacterium]